MDVFEGKVGGDGDLFAGGGAQESAVVADAEAKFPAGLLASRAEGGDDGEFSA